MPSSEDTVKEFLKVYNDKKYAHYHDPEYMTNQVFCPDSATVKPSVGLSDYGPQFVGSAEVLGLFHQIFTSFPNVLFDPLEGRPWLYSREAPPMVAIEADLTGRHDKKWFDKGHAHYSPPISWIEPDRVQHMSLAACSVFTLTADESRIINWSMYFDRYKMHQQLKTSSGS